MANYTEITLDEMREILRESNGWQQIDPATLIVDRVGEHVFEWPIPKTETRVKVFTSIDLKTGVTRKVGSDAIRVCVPGFLKSERVHRVEGWRNNLIARVQDAIKITRERLAERAAKVEAAKAEQAKQPNYSPVFDLLAKGAEHLKRPALKFDVKGQPIKVQAASATSKFKGSLIVTDGGGFGYSKFFGTIGPDGVWVRTKQVTPEVIEVLDGLRADPAGFAAEYGKKSGHCCFCARHLETPESLTVGYGPICANRYSLPWGHVDSEVAQ